MGFADEALNLELLAQYEGSVEAVVFELST
jgi:hypothetical protein